jgi:hypothetical protein
LSRSCFLAVVCLGTGLAATPARAQVTVSSGGGLWSRYVWRGITVTNALVAQPEAGVSARLGSSTLTFGAAGNIEPTRRAGGDDLSQTGGARTGLAEVDVWAEWAHPVGPAGVTLGWLAYTYNAHNGAVTDALNTQELYGKAAAAGLPLAPQVGVWWDVVRMHGVYLEAAVSHSVPLARGVSLGLGATAGYSAGQERRGPDDAFYNFARRGLTHVDLAASLPVPLGPLTATPAAHLQFSPSGQNSRITGARPEHADQARKFWFGVKLGWSREWRGARREAAAAPEAP